MASPLLSNADLIANLEELESSQALAVLLYPGSDPDISRRFDELARKTKSVKFFVAIQNANQIDPKPAGTLLAYKGKKEILKASVSSDDLECTLNFVIQQHGGQPPAKPATVNKPLCKKNTEKIVNVHEEKLELRTDDLSVLFSMVYEELKALTSDKGFPHGLADEATIKSFVEEVVRNVKRFLERKFESQPALLERIESIQILGSRTFQIGLFREDSQQQTIKPDLSIFTKEELVDTDLNKRRKSTKLSDMFAVIVCKSGGIGTAVMRAVSYLRAASDLNPKNNSTFAFCSDAIHYRLLSYNREKKTFKMFEQSKLMFSRMFEERYRDKWMRENTEVLRIIYTVVCEQLNLPTL